jgi:NAD(P)-dependent dehydrogenase (short-subunit alcohol dehydrogenase family)
MSTNIEGKVVVITGASSGLGADAARYLARRGAAVVLGARRKDRLDALTAEIVPTKGTAKPVLEWMKRVWLCSRVGAQRSICILRVRQPQKSICRIVRLEGSAESRR